MQDWNLLHAVFSIKDLRDIIVRTMLLKIKTLDKCRDEKPEFNKDTEVTEYLRYNGLVYAVFYKKFFKQQVLILFNLCLVSKNVKNVLWYSVEPWQTIYKNYTFRAPCNAAVPEIEFVKSETEPWVETIVYVHPRILCLKSAEKYENNRISIKRRKEEKKKEAKRTRKYKMNSIQVLAGKSRHSIRYRNRIYPECCNFMVTVNK
jgi:hypothetical protein